MNFQNRYEIRKELARGGMGRILLAWDHQRRAEVVIKTLLDEGDELSEKNRLRFEREARSLAALRHKNILTIHDFGLEAGQPYMVLPRVTGQNWAEILEQGPVPLERSLRVLGQLAEALDFCHKSGLCHRDLKPSNLLIHEPDPGDEQVLLIDFGLARGAQSNLTRTGEVLGTPLYMAPEIFEGKVPDDSWPAVDVWSYGVLLFETLTGERPFEGNAFELVAAISAASPKSPLKIRSELPRWLVELCLACLRRDPSKRPSFADITKTLRSRRLSLRSDRPQALAATLLLALALLAAFALRPAPGHPGIVDLEIPELSHETHLSFSGLAKNAEVIEVLLNSREPRYELPVASDGRFAGNVQLQEGLNEAIFVARRGATRSPLQTRLAFLDSQRPDEPRWRLQPAWGGLLRFQVQGESGARLELDAHSWILGEGPLSAELQHGSPESISTQFEKRLPWTLTDPAGNITRGEITMDLRPSKTLKIRPDQDPGQILSQTLASLPSPCELRLPPGLYRCRLPIDKNLRILGSSASDCILEGLSDSVIEVLDSRAEVQLDLENLTIRSKPESQHCALKLLKGQLTGLNLIIEARGEAIGLILGSTAFERNPPKFQASLTDCELESAQRAAILVSNQATISLRRCRIQSHADKALLLLGGGRIDLDDTELRGATLGLSIEADTSLPTKASLRRCLFHSQTRAILVRGPSAELDLQNSELRAFEACGLDLSRASKVSILNSLFEGGESAIYAWGASQLNVRQSQFQDISRPLILSGSGTKAELSDCAFTNNHRLPLLTSDRPLALILAEFGARANIQACRFSNHEQPILGAINLARIDTKELNIHRKQIRQFKESGGQIKHHDK